MKHLKLSLAVASILAASQAFAFPPAWPADGDNAAGVDPAGSVVVWHAGASASNLSVQAAVVSTFCDPALPVDLLENVAGSTADFWTVACIIKAGIPTTAGSQMVAGNKLLWNKRNEGGSGVGVQPVANAQTITFLKPSTGAGSICGAAAAGTRLISGINVNTWTCPTSVPFSLNELDPTTEGVARVPDIGTADIEADKFVFAENLSASDLDLDGVRPDAIVNSVAGLAPAANLGQLVFGVYGNLKMWTQLQTAQFPTGHPLFDKCNPAGTLYLKAFTDVTGVGPDLAATAFTRNSNREVCMPSLSSNTIRSVFGSGRQIRAAADFQSESPYQSGIYTALAAAATAGTTTPTTSVDTIMVCRRVKGSGTQAQFNANLLGYPCDATNDNSVDSLLPAAAGALSQNILENESSGDVDNCVNDYNQGTNVGGKNAGLATRWAIGLGSTERNTNLSLNFRYFKIDGFAPTLINVHAGQYSDYAQQVLLHRATDTAGSVFDAYNALIPSMSSAAAMGTLGRDHSFGRAGWMAVPSATVTPVSKLSFTTPINWFRKVSSTGTPNTCALPSAFRPAAGTDITVGPTNCSEDGSDDADQSCYAP